MPGQGKYQKLEKSTIMCGFFIINEESRFQGRFPIENYRPIPDAVELNRSTISTGDVTHTDVHMHDTEHFNKHNAANAHFSNK